MSAKVNLRYLAGELDFGGDNWSSYLNKETGKVVHLSPEEMERLFGMIKSARGIRKFLLRGLEKVSAEWQLICLTHNLLKIWRLCSGVSGC